MKLGGIVIIIGLCVIGYYGVMHYNKPIEPVEIKQEEQFTKLTRILDEFTKDKVFPIALTDGYKLVSIKIDKKNSNKVLFEYNIPFDIEKSKDEFFTDRFNASCEQNKALIDAGFIVDETYYNNTITSVMNLVLSKEFCK